MLYWDYQVDVKNLLFALYSESQNGTWPKGGNRKPWMNQLPPGEKGWKTWKVGELLASLKGKWMG